MQPLLLRARALHGALRHSHAVRFQIRAFSTSFVRPELPKITRELTDKPRRGATRKDNNTNSAAKANAAPDNLIQVGEHNPFHSIYLRDCCTCASCVDSSTRQKNFQTTDIPANIRAKSMVWNDKAAEVEITWENDIPGFSANHVSKYSEDFLQNHSSKEAILRSHHNIPYPRAWDVKRIKKELEFIDFKDYMSDDAALFRVLKLLETHGLVLLRGVPDSETSVEKIGERIGTLRDTFYGRTWDVKSVPEAKNVAYTHQSLGLHQDLLYMEDPPGFQLLHCLKNTCEGGESLFSDGFRAAGSLKDDHSDSLGETSIAYHYKNAGEHYYNQHPVCEFAGEPFQTKSGPRRAYRVINYSPPFQAPLQLVNTEGPGPLLPKFLEAFRRFAQLTEMPSNVLEFRLQEGECVLFNNRRILHGRKAFETAVGERWLKGAYVDTDVFMSRFRVLSEQFPEKIRYSTLESNTVFKDQIQTISAGPEAAARADA